MSAAVSSATLSQHQEALVYWDEFTKQCQHLVKAINEVVVVNKLAESEGVEWKPGNLSAAIVRKSCPSTEVKLDLAFEHWGPKISGSVHGQQEDDLHFYPEEFEFVVGSDQYDRVVAITGEGGSLSPHEFAKYVVQNFRRCYPGITLPCPESPLE
jgi:hypothetical protein